MASLLLAGDGGLRDKVKQLQGDSLERVEGSNGGLGRKVNSAASDDDAPLRGAEDPAPPATKAADADTDDEPLLSHSSGAEKRPRLSPPGKDNHGEALVVLPPRSRRPPPRSFSCR